MRERESNYNLFQESLAGMRQETQKPRESVIPLSSEILRGSLNGKHLAQNNRRESIEYELGNTDDYIDSFCNNIAAANHMVASRNGSRIICEMEDSFDVAGISVINRAYKKQFSADRVCQASFSNLHNRANNHNSSHGVFASRDGSKCLARGERRVNRNSIYRLLF